MSADKITIDVYNARAGEYARLTEDLDGVEELRAFTTAMPKGGHVLDLGCGPGLYAAFMGEAGLTVDAVDASVEMVKLAAKHPNVTARKATFGDITGENRYDGVWANFSLLHASRDDFPKHLAALHRASKPGAMFHIGMKIGSNAARDRLERAYTYYQEDELLAYLTDAGFKIRGTKNGSGPGLEGSISDWVMVSAHA